MEAITRQQLMQKLERHDDFVLVDTLDPEQYQRSHLPSAINVPLGPDFADRIAVRVPDRSTEVVVYSGNEDCRAASTALCQMTELGYDHVLRFPEGKEGWLRSGLSLEHGRDTA